jgi:hypothetical protein
MQHKIECYKCGKDEHYWNIYEYNSNNKNTNEIPEHIMNILNVNKTYMCLCVDCFNQAKINYEFSQMKHNFQTIFGNINNIYKYTKNMLYKKKSKSEYY